MSTAKRYKLGILLIALSVLAAAGLFVTDLSLSHPKKVGAGLDSNGYWSVTTWKSEIGGFYLVPILIGATGLLCLMWPQRKPPKLPA